MVISTVIATIVIGMALCFILVGLTTKNAKKLIIILILYCNLYLGVTICQLFPPMYVQ